MLVNGSLSPWLEVTGDIEPTNCELGGDSGFTTPLRHSDNQDDHGK